MIKAAENQELAAKGIEVPIELGSACNACDGGSLQMSTRSQWAWSCSFAEASPSARSVNETSSINTSAAAQRRKFLILNGLDHDSAFRRF